MGSVLVFAGTRYAVFGTVGQSRPATGVPSVQSWYVDAMDEHWA